MPLFYYCSEKDFMLNQLVVNVGSAKRKRCKITERENITHDCVYSVYRYVYIFAEHFPHCFQANILILFLVYCKFIDMNISLSGRLKCDFHFLDTAMVDSHIFTAFQNTNGVRMCVYFAIFSVTF